MCSEFTIDSQLSELGFSEILQPKQKPEDDKSCPMPSCNTVQAAETKKLEVDREQKEDIDIGKEAGSNNAASVETDDSEGSEVDEEMFEEEEEEEEEEDIEVFEDESSNTGEYRCHVCDILLSSNFKLQDHMNLHTGARPYCCAECGKRFCQIHNYRAHLRTHARGKPSPLDPLRCRICLKGFDKEEGLKEHLATSHFEKEFYECDLCKRIFTDFKLCELHMETHKRTLGEYVCDICNRHFTKQKLLNRHQKIFCRSSYRCTDCARVFEKKNALLKHSFSHLGLLPYTCVRCRRHFRLAKFYLKHKCEPQQIHCVACLGVFLSQDDFEKHKKDTGCWGHQGSKDGEIRCMECGQTFSSVEELKKHAGAHQRVLTCSECGKGFHSALLLMSHMGGHAGQRPCLCQSCGLGFPHQQAYDSHLKCCGRTTPVSTQRKRPTAKSSSDPSLKKSKIAPKLPIPAKPANTSVQANISTTNLVGDIKSPPVSAKDSCSMKPQGVWKLELDKEPPPGINLVMFVPVNSSIGNVLMAPYSKPQTLPIPDVQSQPCVGFQSTLELTQVTESHKANPYFGQSPVVRAPLHLDVPLDLAINHRVGPITDIPLDLSKKIIPPNALTHDASDNTKQIQPECSNHPSRKEEKSLRLVENSIQVLKTEEKLRTEYSKTTAERDMQMSSKQPNAYKIDPSSLNIGELSPGLMTNVKKEPHSPCADLELLQPESCDFQPLKQEDEIKMENVKVHMSWKSLSNDTVEKLIKKEEDSYSGEKENVFEKISKGE